MTDKPQKAQTPQTAQAPQDAQEIISTAQGIPDTIRAGAWKKGKNNMADKLTELWPEAATTSIDEIDPDSPNYNPEKAKAYQEQLTPRLAAAIIAMLKENGKAPEEIKESTKEELQAILKRLQLSDQLQEIAENLRKFVPPNLSTVARLLPYMKELTAGPKYKDQDKTAIEIIQALELKGTDKDGHIIPGSQWEQLIKDAETAKSQADIKAIARRVNSLEFPLDKVNSTVWGLLEKDTQGQIALKAEKAGSKDELNIFYSINFDALENVRISKRLTAFDKTVYVAAAALFNAGNDWITLTQIYYAMGNDRNKKPASYQLEKIMDSVRKMKAANIFINNTQEAGKYDYPVFQYEGDLLPTEKITATVNGKLTDAAIHMFREPPLVTFAKKRNQVTTISVKLLAAPISKTENHLAIQDYLIERISRAKHGEKKQERILYSTLASKAEGKAGKKSRLQEAVETYLNHFKAEAWINSYITDKDGITVYL